MESAATGHSVELEAEHMSKMFLYFHKTTFLNRTAVWNIRRLNLALYDRTKVTQNRRFVTYTQEVLYKLRVKGKAIPVQAYVGP